MSSCINPDWRVFCRPRSRLQRAATTLTERSAPMTSRIALILVAAGIAAAASSANAATVNSSARGYYQSTGVVSQNNNYLTGNNFGTAHRSYFVFTIPAAPGPGQGVISATLSTRAFTVTDSFTVTLYDFSGSIPGLAARTGTAGVEGVQRFNDLGTGTVYGSRNFQPSEQNITVSYGLNAAALANINMNLGSSFALGGTSSAESITGAFAYGSSQADFAFNGDVQLILTFGDLNLVPLPTGVFMGLGGLACAGIVGVIRRRRLA